MIILFEIIKIFFFLLTIGMGIFFLRGFYYLPNESFVALGNIFMPAYLLVVGLMLGYVGIIYYKTKSLQPLTSKQYVTSFILGLVTGIMLACIYIFLH